MYTSKDYGVLFLNINQDVYHLQTNQDTFYPTSYTMGRDKNKSNVGEANPISD